MPVDLAHPPNELELVAGFEVVHSEHISQAAEHRFTHISILAIKRVLVIFFDVRWVENVFHPLFHDELALGLIRLQLFTERLAALIFVVSREFLQVQIVPFAREGLLPERVYFVQNLV